MLKLFTPAETTLWLEHCRDYVIAEFGPGCCSSVENWYDKNAKRQFIHQPYGDFDTDPPTILGIMTCIPLGHRDYDALKAGEHKDNELVPWTPADGPAVLWVDVVISDSPGVAAKCIGGMLRQLDDHPCKRLVDTLAMVCTGPQGYLMAQSFGLEPTGIEYKPGEPFMELPMTPAGLDRLGEVLPDTWNVGKARDAVELGRSLWGPHWRDHRL